MGRLIDTSNIIVKPQYMQDVMGIAMIRCEDLSRILADVPTVEAIPKADIQKALKEGSKDISENVLAIVREEYISKSDYENRLKAEMVDILEKIDLQFDEICFCRKAEWKTVPEIKAEYKAVIQQEIKALKENEDGKINHCR